MLKKKTKNKNHTRFQKKLALADHLTFTLGARNVNFYLVEPVSVSSCRSF